MKVILFDIDTLRADHMGCYGSGPIERPGLILPLIFRISPV